MSGWPNEATSDRNIELVHSLIMCDCRRSLQKAKQKGISFGAVKSILIDIRWVLRMWTKDQKKSMLDICLSLEMTPRNSYVEL